MAQHIPIANFEQKSMRKIEESIRKETSFSGSLKYEKLPDDFKENDEDMVFGTERTAPQSITGMGREFFEVHTKPITGTNRRIATNIYLVA